MNAAPAAAAAPERTASGRWLAVALVAAGLTSVLWSARAVVRDPRRAMLVPSAGPGIWIVYPHLPRIGARPAVELETRFRASFEVPPSPPGTAAGPPALELELRAYRHATVVLNGAPLPLPAPPDGNWKRVVRIEVGERLRRGTTNEIEVAATNGRGPPALWLRLRDGERTLLATDTTWEASLVGATPLPARAASTPFAGAQIDPDVPGRRPLVDLVERAPTLLLLLALASGLVLGGGALARRLSGIETGGAPRAPGPALRLALAGVAVLWSVLLVNNAASLWGGDGFDAEGHQQYIQHILDHGELPGPELGWSTFQPPLYYVVSAASLGLAGVSPYDPGGALVLRLQALVFGLAQLAFLAAGLRLLFPTEPRAQLTGLLVAAFLPLQFQMYELVLNDGLAGTLSAAAAYLVLRALRGPREPAPGLHALLGACLGAALLAKASALIVAALALAALALRALVGRHGPGQWLRGPVVAGATFVLVCGWHYGSVWARFGSPLVGNWDPRIQPPWWQDPGYLTPAFYLRFGRALTEPLLSAFASFADGIYTTLWGDGSIGGRAAVWLAPPWNDALMGAGYVLALVPTLLVAVGAAAAVRRAWRERDGAWGFVVALAGATAFALAVWPLGLPVYSVIKASFALPAMLALCACVGAGLEWLGRRPIPRTILLVALGVWALNAYATFWIPRASPAALARLGWLHAATGAPEGLARARLEAALAADSGNAVALLGLARLDLRNGCTSCAEQRLDALLRAHPDHVRGHLKRAELLESLGRVDEAADHYRRVLALRESDPLARLGLGRWYAERGEPERAEAHLREALRGAPTVGEIHDRLGRVLEAQGRTVEGRRHRALADRLGYRPAEAAPRGRAGAARAPRRRRGGAVADRRVDPAPRRSWR